MVTLPTDVPLQGNEFREVLSLIEAGRSRAYHAVNVSLINTYWQVGEYLSHTVQQARWGRGIEGTQLSLAQAERLWVGEVLAEARADDTLELLNYRDAFTLMSDYLDSGDPIIEGLIREIHKRLVQGVRGGDAEPGSYRKIQNFVANSLTRDIIYTPPPPEQVPILMRELVDWLRRDSVVHPVLVAGIAQFQLVHIHPFVDGKGRTSRLLSTLSRYRAGYDFKRLFTLSEYYDHDRGLIYAALQGVREQDMDLTGWLEYFVSGLAAQLDEIKARGTAVIRADVLGKERHLSARQSAVLAEILSRGRLTLRDLKTLFADVTRRSLQRDLKVLSEKKLILESGISATDPHRSYIAPPAPKL